MLARTLHGVTRVLQSLRAASVSSPRAHKLSWCQPFLLRRQERRSGGEVRFGMEHAWRVDYQTCIRSDESRGGSHMRTFNDDYQAGTPPWDTGRPQPRFVTLGQSGAVQGSVLDVGCGTGENGLYFASLGHEV